MMFINETERDEHDEQVEPIVTFFLCLVFCGFLSVRNGKFIFLEFLGVFSSVINLSVS